MKLVPKDYDYVMVGVTESYLISRNWVPNGKQFPVFIHPEFPGVQLAIARSDRKIAAGYNGFSWKAALSLHDDLLRRDFTVNAIAETLDGELIDPFGGEKDIYLRLLREVSRGHFGEDPLRVFRAGRFAARLNFIPSLSLIDAMKDAVPELPTVATNRVREELLMALKTERPDMFFSTLRSGNALYHWFPEVHNLLDVPAGPVSVHGAADVWYHTMLALLAAKRMAASSDAMLMTLSHDFGKAETQPMLWPAHHKHETKTEGIVSFGKRLGFSKDLVKKMTTHCEYHLSYHRAREMRPGSLVRMYRAVKRWQVDFITACEADAQGRIPMVTDRDNYVSGLFHILNYVQFPPNCGGELAVRLLEKAATQYRKENKNAGMSKAD